jgi:hypothetical protein
MPQVLPHARQQSVIVKDLLDEVLIYDLDRNKAHCLNQSAAIVWRNCDGKSSISQIRKVLQKELSTPVSEEVVWLAIDQLNQFHLLEQGITRPQNGVSRRSVLKNIGIAALAIPAIVSISAPTAQAQASCLPRDTPCTTNAQCCSGNCRGIGNGTCT